MKASLKLISVILAVVVLLSLAAGCSPKQSSAAPAPTPAPSPAPAAQSSAAPAPATAPAKKNPVKWGLGTSSSGSNPNNLGICIAKVISDKSDFVEVAAQVTAGYKENTVLVGSGELKIAMGNAFDLHQAYNQEGGYAGMDELKNIRRMFGFTPTYLHLIVRADSDIYSVSDLKGKRYNMNTPSSTTYPIALHVLQSAGMDVGDVKVFEVATGPSLDGIRDNLFDCTCNTYGIGASQLLELSSTVPIRIVPLSNDEFKKLNELRYGTTQLATIPANTYKGQTEDTNTFVHFNVLYAHKDADEEAVYEMTKLFWENLSELQQLNVGFKGLELSVADAGPSTVPMHPGAEKYFKEVGLIK